MKRLPITSKAHIELTYEQTGIEPLLVGQKIVHDLSELAACMAQLVGEFTNEHPIVRHQGLDWRILRVQPPLFHPDLSQREYKVVLACPATGCVMPPDLANECQPKLTVRLVSCLLYTSPSPRDRQKSRMPSSA